MRIAICDDETVQRRYLQAVVDDWASTRGASVRIYHFGSAEEFLFAYEDDKGFDVLLLDIQMKAMDGVALAKRIRQDNEALQIVFATAFPDFIAEGYEVSALHYLLKPIDERKFFAVLDKAAVRLSMAPRAVLLKRGASQLRIPADDIYYAEAFSHSVTLHTRAGQETFAMRLGDMEDCLGEGFFRCHRSYIVRLKHVRLIRRAALTLDTGKEIPLSRSLYDAANQAFIRSF